MFSMCFHAFLCFSGVRSSPLHLFAAHHSLGTTLSRARDGKSLAPLFIVRFEVSDLQLLKVVDLSTPIRIIVSSIDIYIIVTEYSSSHQVFC